MMMGRFLAFRHPFGDVRKIDDFAPGVSEFSDDIDSALRCGLVEGRSVYLLVRPREFPR